MKEYKLQRLKNERVMARVALKRILLEDVSDEIKKIANLGLRSGSIKK